MTITLPSGQPDERFMRYVRPPVSDHEDHPPLFPLHPATRRLRLGIDVTTVPTPPDGLLTGYLTRDEIDVQLLLSEDQEVPSKWAALLPAATTVRVGFTAVPESWPMMLAFSVGFAAGSETRRTGGRAEFFPAYQLADAQAVPGNAQPLNSSQRHHAAAYAAVAAKVNIDAIVTNAPTAGRPDVADNDIVIAVTPDDAVALMGLYLRITANPVVGVERGALAGDIGSWGTTLTTGTIENLYSWGLVSHMRYFEIFQALATHEADSATVTALGSIRLRLTRAARALDHMLAALCNPLKNNREADVIETAAEAFDRELLYLAAAFDIYGRRYPLLTIPRATRRTSTSHWTGRATSRTTWRRNTTPACSSMSNGCTSARQCARRSATTSTTAFCPSTSISGAATATPSTSR